MSKTLEFFFDLGSPTTYLAYTQLPGICAETGSQLVYQPILLGGIFKATGNASPVTIPAKGRYLLQDLARYAKRYGVPLKFNPHFPINTLTLMRAVTGIQLRQPERFIDFIDCLFRAIWVEGRNMGDPAVVAAVLAQHHFDPAQVLELTQDEEVKDALKHKTEEAIARGMFGAPAMFVGQQLFFGQDRLDFVREALS
ncbi:2-hydroxychromene-2-carboxylate isomerase [Pseudomonas fluorescens]|jgi:2-hydroxychromene-2-carboxylate isomerase|uniref:2-hydroxychromene-2-carboxylate isomerase n=1 Tax=Pseudomonas shahriarae TaxID=2745512 RepID=A0ABT5N7E4_9PSED|nr:MULTISPECIES: 2-hydroxychromene-2-carboxylate isomerase [Pseudomonas]AYG07432.1 2-hydroxychromene-2-carboxylate isomerase [Pseudomonas fluorescens]MBJ2240849.1 2-hydroxychromene-2-carboxylate isomerase [Pseudomonas sp. MF6768]MBJ2252991.1 2-hydroxychromene-2-carboxylate isomerase [Pseudomonas sp. MF6784]MBJ2263352.1 2-hydroxychromene-2-carboxylate isomerase [Pseudomonas sp. MF6787]MBJ2293804.1 2-hydroxychromene-2-carboxylate isomerase [Pseudomonas sp. MF5691]